MGGDPHIVKLPRLTWRIGWRTAPATQPKPRPLDLADSRAGGRYDSIDGSFRVLYSGTQRYAALVEVLDPLRPKASLADLVRPSWGASHKMLPGNIPASWRQDRLWTEVHRTSGGRYIDMLHGDTIAWLSQEAKPIILSYGFESVGVSELTGPDRRLTRNLSSWLYHLQEPDGSPRYDGIKYGSRHGDDLECWAIFERTTINVGKTKTIELTDPEIQRAETALGLHFH